MSLCGVWGQWDEMCSYHRQLPVPSSYTPSLRACDPLLLLPVQGWEGRGGSMDLSVSNLCSPMQTGCLVKSLIFHTSYLCLAHKNCKLQEAFTHIACSALCYSSYTPLSTPPFKWKDGFHYPSTEQENYWAIVRLKTDSCKISCLFVWPQNWSFYFYFLEKICLWKHKKPHQSQVIIFGVEQRWTDMLRIIVCLICSPQLLCRQNALKYVYKTFNNNTPQMETLSTSVCTQELDERSWEV